MTVRGTKNSPIPVRSQPTSKTDAPKAPAKAEKAGAAADVKSTFEGHTASIDVSKTSNPAAIKAQGKVVADSVMNVIGSYGKSFLLDTDGDAVFIYTPPSIHSRSVSKARDKLHAAKLYKNGKDRYPLVIFLHGAFGRGTCTARILAITPPITMLAWLRSTS